MITTANLLTFENDQVVESSGEVVNSESIAIGNLVAVAPYFTRSFQQIVEVILKTQIISDIKLKLKDGRVLNTTISTYWQAEIANIQNYGSSGDRQSIVHVGHSTQSFVIQDNDLPTSGDAIINKHKNAVPENAIVSVNTSLSYPLVLNLNLLSKKLFDDNEFFVDYDVKLVHSKGVDISLHMIVEVSVVPLHRMVSPGSSYHQRETMELVQQLLNMNLNSNLEDMAEST